MSDINVNNEYTKMNNLSPFKLCVIQNFPFIEADFDAVTNYQLLCKVVEYLNNVIDNNNKQNTNITQLEQNFITLYNYVKDYFDNLDVQEEINKKLDEMAADGSLSKLIQPLFDKYKTSIDNEVNTQNEKIDVLEKRMNTFTSLPDGSTVGDAELADIKVGYDGTVYSTPAVAVRTQVKNLNNDVTYISEDNNINIKKLAIKTSDYQLEISLKKGKKYIFSINDTLDNAINFYINESEQYFDLAGKFNKTIKEFNFIPVNDITKLYVKCYASYKDYFIYVKEVDVIEKLNDYAFSTSSNLYNSLNSVIKVNFKKNNQYNIALTSAVPTVVVNFYTDSSRTVETLVGGIRPTNKNIVFNCNSDIEYLYTSVYNETDRKTYDFSIYTNNNILPHYTPVILDTDFGGDIDDLSALATLLWAERSGMCDIIGVNCSVPRIGEYNGVAWQLIPAIDGVCNYFGVSDMSFGLDHSLTPARNSNYCGTAYQYTHTLTSNFKNGEPSIEFYRRALTSVPDGEMIEVCIIGITKAFGDFLSSPSDKYSKLTGLELANKKIKTLYIMGGQFPVGKVETNLAGGDGKGNAIDTVVEASYKIFNDFKNNIVLIGSENAAHCGDILFDNKLNFTLLYKCMNEFMTNAFNKGDNPWGYKTLEETWKAKDYAWDVLAVLCMVFQTTDTIGFTKIQGTANIINDKTSENYGVNTFTQNNTGKHYYVKKTVNISDDYQSYIMDSIISQSAWVDRKKGRVRLSRYYHD